MEVITVSASALSQFSKSRSSGTHYSSEGGFPAVAGADGVGSTEDGNRVYFVLPEAPYGALAAKCLVDVSHCVEISDSLDDATAAAMANPRMSACSIPASKNVMEGVEPHYVDDEIKAIGVALCRNSHKGARMEITPDDLTIDLRYNF